MSKALSSFSLDRAFVIESISGSMKVIVIDNIITQSLYEISVIRNIAVFRTIINEIVIRGLNN